MRTISDQPPHTTTATTTTTASVSQAASPVIQPRALGHYHHNRLSNSFSQHSALLPDPASPELLSSSPSLTTTGGANLPEQRIIPGLVHERTRKGSNYSMSSSGAVTAATRADLLHSQSQLQSQAASSPSRFEAENGGEDFGVI